MANKEEAGRNVLRGMDSLALGVTYFRQGEGLPPQLRDGDIGWVFPSQMAARAHLREYEPYLAQLGLKFSRPSVVVVARATPFAPAKAWRITCRGLDPVPEGCYVYLFDSEAEAKESIACNAKSVLKFLERRNYHTAIVRIAGQEDIKIPIETLRLMAQFEPAIELFFADTSLPPIVLEQATLKSQQEGRWGIVRLSDERQVVMSSGMTGVLLAGVGIDETTQWKRPEFWNLEQLREFNQLWRSTLDTEGTRSLEYRYQIRKPGTDDPWEYYRSSYRLIDAAGQLYQMCTFVDRG